MTTPETALVSYTPNLPPIAIAFAFKPRDEIIKTPALVLNSAFERARSPRHELQKLFFFSLPTKAANTLRKTPSILIVESLASDLIFHFKGPVDTAKMTLEQPAGEMWQKIREELNENVDTRDADLAHIKDWLKKEPHLPDEFDDQRIMTFLRGCKFSLEKTKRKLDMYFTMRAAVPEFFNDRDVMRPELQEILNIVQMPPLPGLTPDGRRVVLMRGLDKDVQTPNVADAFKLALMMGDVRLAEEKEGVAGDVYILDASVATPTHFAKFTPTLVKKFLVCVQEAYPVKLKEVHVINVSPLVDKIVNFVKPFIKEKIRDRIFLHSDANELHKYVPKEMLPAEYGGNAGPMNDLHNAWVQKMAEYKDWFAEQENLKANEMLRPGKPTNYDELFGIDGSFRQLVID